MHLGGFDQEIIQLFLKTGVVQAAGKQDFPAPGRKAKAKGTGHVQGHRVRKGQAGAPGPRLGPQDPGP